MKSQFLKMPVTVTMGLLLTAPAAYFIFVSVLKYLLGLPALFDAIEPLLNAAGIKNSSGRNVNVLLVFGPLFCFLMNAASIVVIKFEKRSEAVYINLSIEKRKSNLIAVIVSGGVLAVLFLYALGEKM